MARKPKYRRHRERNLGFVEHDKRRIYFSGPYDSDESRDQYVTFLRSLGFLVYERGPTPSTVTLSLLANRFIVWAEATYPSGRKSYCANLRDALRLLGKFYGRDDLAVNFTPLRMKAFQTWMIARELSRRYINDTTANVRRLFKWGVSEELIPVATYQALLSVPGLAFGRTQAKEMPPRKPVDRAIIAATLRKLNPTVRAMVQFQQLTGARSQSLCAARVGQFDRTKQPWEWRPKHKTQRTDPNLILYVGPRAQKIIGPFIKGKQLTDFVFQPVNKSGKRSKLYRSFYDTDTYRRAVERAALKAGVAHWFPHLLRHTRGTDIRDRHGLEAAQASLGHRRIDATQMYTESQKGKAKMVARKMG